MNTQATYKEATQVATFTELKRAINGKHRKEKIFLGSLVVIAERKIIAEMRFYKPSHDIFCCLWINDAKHNLHADGSGRAGGYGGDMLSESAQMAIDSTGIKLSNDIFGRGRYDVIEALKAIAVSFGYNANEIDVHDIHA